MSGSKPIIGLCGGIGSGKSRVAAEFAALGCLVIDSDKLNHEILQRREVIAELRRWWGERVLGAAGHLDRRKLAAIVFENEEQRRRLEALVHPLIEERRRDMMNQVAADQLVPAIVLDSPLLFESQLDRICDAIIFVDANAEVRLARLQATRNWDSAQLRRREQWQLPAESKRLRADFIIENNGAEQQLRAQVAAVLHKIQSRHSTSR